ncbi:MAG: RsmB/NOP family class I SAM-dependent RNA methyltransferase [Flavobacteriales bacterium]
MMNTRINPAWIQAISEILEEVFAHGRKADKAMEQLFSANRKYGRNDRAFIAESAYEIIRYWRLWHYLLEREPGFRKKELWEVFGVYWLSAGNSLPDWSEFKDLQKKDFRGRMQEAEQKPEIRYSVGDELQQRALAQLDTERWNRELAAMNEPADLILRCNILKNSVAELQKKLAAEGIQTRQTPFTPYALICEHRWNVFSSPLFRAGCFEVQDAGSQKIAEICAVKPGMTVIDACAGAGGKSLFLAAEMQNKGRIISMDTEAWKLEELKKRAARAGIDTIQTEQIRGLAGIKNKENRADVLLLDVPCSGSGVLKRNPDAKYRITNSFVDELKLLQGYILKEYARMVKPGGALVYATCSLLPEENQQQTQAFLLENKNFEPVAEQTVYPSEQGFDGFYMSRMIRKV